MSWIILIIVGGIIGWLASIIMKTDWEQGTIANIIVGIIGSLLAKWVFGDVLKIGGASMAGTFTWAGFLWGILGAVVLILILKALRVLR